MPQTFQVLRCYKCLIFQIHQTKKSNKWECKLCGEKQSIKRHYGIGTGKDCRLHVQKLNEIQGENVKTPVYDSNSEPSENDECTEVDKIICKPNKSKWTSYIDNIEENKVTDEPMYLQDQEVVLEMPKKAKIIKIRSQNRKQYQHSWTSENDDICNDELPSENHEINNAATLNTIPIQRKYSKDMKSQIWKPPFNNQKLHQYDNLVPGIENISENTIDSNYNYDCSSDSNEPKQSDTILKRINKDSSTQKVKKSKWDQFIEKEEQDILDNDSCEMNMVITEKDSNTIFSEKASLENTPNISNNEHSTSLFSQSNDCDLDDILNY